MGIPELWKFIEPQEEVVAIAKLSQDHYQTHGRPLRIAIDEASWRFNNLSQAQVYAIRERSTEPAFQGIEKQIFYRICRLLLLNIDLLFIFDGPKRPWKRGRHGSGKVDYEKIKLLKETLRCLKIPYHQAPGEAEAECARLQVLGIVDAVWSDDSDTLMFGCDFFIRDCRLAKEKGNNDKSRENTKKSRKIIKVIRGQDIRKEHGFDREGLVLFAMLCGGDYDTKGLSKCGPATAKRAIQAGLGRSLCRCQTRTDCEDWREELLSFFQSSGTDRGIHVPFDFPDIKTLNKYNHPTVSTDEQLRNLHLLKDGWRPPIDELKLLELTSSRFNIWGKLYLNWIGPILLLRSFVARDRASPRENKHDIKFTKLRVNKNDTEPTPAPLERKLTFSPFGVTSLKEKDFHRSEREGYWTGAKDQPFDRYHRVECEFPEIWLQKTLPLDILIPPPAEPEKTGQKRKRKETGDEDSADHNAVQTAPKRKRKSKANDPSHSDAASAKRTPTASKASRTTKDSAARAGGPVVLEVLEDSDEENGSPMKNLPLPIRKPLEPIRSEKLGSPASTSPSTGRSRTRLPQMEIVDLCSDVESEDDDEEEQLNRAIQPSLQKQGTPKGRIKAPSRDPMAWEEWEEDPDNLFIPPSPKILIGTSSTIPFKAPVVPTPTIQHSPSSTSARKKSTTKQIPSRSQNWSFSPIQPPSASTRKTTSPVAQASLHPEPLQDPLPLNPTDVDPTDAAGIRAARLRHFEIRVKKAERGGDDSPQGSIHVASTAAPRISTPKTGESMDKVESTKQVQVECIDLTDL